MYVLHRDIKLLRNLKKEMLVTVWWQAERIQNIYGIDVWTDCQVPSHYKNIKIFVSIKE